MSDTRLVECINAGGTKFWYFVGIGADVNGKDRSGTTPLIAAVKAGNKSAITALPPLGAIIDEVDGEGNTALVYAIRNNDTFAITYLSRP